MCTECASIPIPCASPAINPDKGGTRVAILDLPPPLFEFSFVLDPVCSGADCYESNVERGSWVLEHVVSYLPTCFWAFSNRANPRKHA